MGTDSKGLVFVPFCLHIFKIFIDIGTRIGYNRVMVEIVAEIGINHNGSLATAKDMIDAARDCGADTCKFQIFNADLTNDGDLNLWFTLQKTQLLPAQIIALRDYCQKRGMGFLCSAFDRPSIDTLVAMGETRIKIPSSRNNIPEYMAYVDKQPFTDVVYATGASNTFSCPIKDKRVILVECISAYPCDPSRFVFTDWPPWGLSDHSMSWEACIAAVACGACYIEKHFTLDQNAEGPDHKASLNPAQFKQMVREIHSVEQILSNMYKVVLPEERSTVARKIRHDVSQYM